MQSIVIAETAGFHGEQERSTVIQVRSSKRKARIQFLEDLELSNIQSIENCLHRVATGGYQHVEGLLVEQLRSFGSDAAQHSGRA